MLRILANTTCRLYRGPCASPRLRHSVLRGFRHERAARHVRRPSVCPHDCPSVCALDVEVVEGKRIGRVHGAADQPYTAGVVCAKVARYAERIHHPDRLTQPLRRVGPKGSGSFRPSAGTRRSTASPRPSSKPRASTAPKASGPISMRARWASSCATASNGSPTPSATRASLARSAPALPGPDISREPAACRGSAPTRSRNPIASSSGAPMRWRPRSI